jgi:hypothetical protein
VSAHELAGRGAEPNRVFMNGAYTNSACSTSSPPIDSHTMGFENHWAGDTVAPRRLRHVSR